MYLIHLKQELFFININIKLGNTLENTYFKIQNINGHAIKKK